MSDLVKLYRSKGSEVVDSDVLEHMGESDVEWVKAWKKAMRKK